jgi:hypothetical protein
VRVAVEHEGEPDLPWSWFVTWNNAEFDDDAGGYAATKEEAKSQAEQHVSKFPAKGNDDERAGMIYALIGDQKHRLLGDRAKAEEYARLYALSDADLSRL